MWRSLITVGLVFALGAPAFADQTTATIKKRTVKKSVVVHHRVTRRETNFIPLPPAPPPAPVAIVRPPPGYWRWVPSQQSYTWVPAAAVAPTPLLVWAPFR